MSLSRPLVIGHRGAPGYRPEHTRSSYELAFAQGADAVEPDVVVSRDGVLVIRHENEISGTTDVADRDEFAARRATKTVDGRRVEGWFAEDFTWAELATLRARERLPLLRPESARHDGEEGMLRLTDLLELVDAASGRLGRPIGVVLEIKHATYLAGRGWDVAELVAAAVAEWGGPLVIESFESGVLDRVRERGVRASYVYLMEARGAAFDLVAALGARAPTYAEQSTPAGLDALAGRVDGISVDKAVLLRGGTLAADARARGLRVFTWTCRAENVFLDERFRTDAGPGARGDYRAEWAAIRDAGVDAVFVDQPDLWLASIGVDEPR